jgi:hypothetical protein
MGFIDEAGKVAENVASSLRAQPILLGLLILHLATLALLWIVLATVAENRTKDIRLIYENHVRTQELLARCGKG